MPNRPTAGRAPAGAAVLPAPPIRRARRQPLQHPLLRSWFLPEEPGLPTLAAHVLLTGHGAHWSEGPTTPRAAVVHCGPYRLLRGDPRFLRPERLAPLERGQFSMPDRFLPLLGATFSPVMPWVRLVYTQQLRPRRQPLPVGVRLRPLTPLDTARLDALGQELRWITETWGSSRALARTGGAWGAFVDGRLASVATVHLRGVSHEDLAVVTAPEFRRAGLALACVLAAATAIRHRGRIPTWSTPRSNGPSRALAEAAGFLPVREELVYWAGPAR
ncbi:GNAT family N-acetyltransferase [Kitasatospora kifunensis]|uniref:GNAT superfamily N-acetyltransferase n=1 Tax=Kitasatospora kifunensis TaxID=58351 RepID=A0A7W7QX38_KITKI|nr:GNAT family N-acetyltransferase [Kitasatospora kifunensis]MBB4921362.1 GNAT superfamily N-acetyltransferase [Kitasatospora kifunensis]